MEVTFSDGTREPYEDNPWKQGAQGTIHRSPNGQHLVKLFTNLQDAAKIQARLQQVDKIIGEYNVVKGDPYWAELFAWPDKRVTSPRLGVRIPFVNGLMTIDHYFFGPAYADLSPEKRGWWIGRAATAIKLARAVQRLTSRGLCHADLSEKNVLVDPLEGRVTIIDCDSLVVPSETPVDVLGTKEYMAPELMSGKVKIPSVETDRHALAVLLYRWLLYHHPLLGTKVHDPDPGKDEWYALGERALYVGHPTDISNRTKEDFPTADTLTPRLRELFLEAFVKGLHEPTLRPLPSRWEHALIEMFDRIIPCSNLACEQRFFVAQDSRPLRCPLCKTYVDFPGRIPFLKLRTPMPERGGGVQYRDEGIFSHYVVGWPERPLYLWHALPGASVSPDLTTGVAPDTKPRGLIRYDADAGEWYLENLGLPQLAVALGTTPTPQWQTVPLGSRVPLRQNLQLLLGQPDVARIAFIEMRRVQ